MKTPTENVEEKNKQDAILNELNMNTYNDLILAQDKATFKYLLFDIIVMILTQQTKMFIAYVSFLDLHSIFDRLMGFKNSILEFI